MISICKSFLILGMLLLAGGSQSFGQDMSWISANSDHTAYTMPAHKWESGLIQPFRFGLCEKMELRANLLIMPLLPNLGIKMKLIDLKGFQVSSEHTLSIPSVFLNTVSRKGTGGLLSPEFDFPFMLGFNNALLTSHKLSNTSLISAKAELAFVIRTGKIDQLSTIDLPVFFPRMAHYYKGASIRLQTGVSGTLFPFLYYDESVQVFITTRKKENFHAENTGSLIWAPGRKVRIKTGYILTGGVYPFGRQWQLWPVVDIIFGNKTDKSKKQ